MVKFNKRNLLNLEHVNNSPLLNNNSKGVNNKMRIQKIKERIRIKKIKSLFHVNYNKSAKSCNPCMEACKKVDRKINGRELSDVSNNEMKKLIKVFSS
jgi:hypothetical protein